MLRHQNAHWNRYTSREKIVGMCLQINKVVFHNHNTKKELFLLQVHFSKKYCIIMGEQIWYSYMKWDHMLDEMLL